MTTSPSTSPTPPRPPRSSAPGERDRPDGRGRTGLDATGRDLDGGSRVDLGVAGRVDCVGRERSPELLCDGRRERVGVRVGGDDERLHAAQSTGSGWLHAAS